MGELLTRKQLAEMLQLSKSALDNLTSGRTKGMNPPPRIKLGRRVFFRPESVRAWLAANEQSTGGQK